MSIPTAPGRFSMMSPSKKRRSNSVGGLKWNTQNNHIIVYVYSHIYTHVNMYTHIHYNTETHVPYADRLMVNSCFGDFWCIWFWQPLVCCWNVYFLRAISGEDKIIQKPVTPIEAKYIASSPRDCSKNSRLETTMSVQALRNRMDRNRRWM